MKWYSKYLPVYEKPFAEVPAETVAEVRAKLAERQSDRPLATVSVIACNEEKRLTACLWSLAEQRCRYPMEIIATDNLSKDRTAEIFETLGLPWQRETTPGCGHARLCGLNRARGKYHINIDADTIYPPRYVETMVDALERRGVVAASSLWSYIPDAAHSAAGLWLYELARDTHLWLQSFQRPELSVRGLVFAYDTELARKVGIRTDIIRGEDGSLALGLKPYGRIAFVRSRRARRDGLRHRLEGRHAAGQFPRAGRQGAERPRRNVFQKIGIQGRGGQPVEIALWPGPNQRPGPKCGTRQKASDRAESAGPGRKAPDRKRPAPPLYPAPYSDQNRLV